MKKISKIFLVVLLFIQFIPGPIAAQELTNETTIDNNLGEETEEKHEVYLFAEEIDGEIELYKDETDLEFLAYIPDDSLVEVLVEEDEESDYLYIKYILEDEELEFLEGYVHRDYIVEFDDADSYREKRTNPGATEKNEKEEAVVDEEIDEEVEKQEESDSVTPELDEEKEPEIEEIEEIEESEESTEKNTVNTFKAKKIENLTGFAIKQPISVYTEKSRNGKVLKSYSYGHMLKFRSHTDEWFEATVYVNGKPQKGYIHTSDVGDTKGASAVNGVALKKSTSVYSNKNKTSKVLKGYKQGHILKYKAHDKDWFIATVFINGKARTGYIHAEDVETATTMSKSVSGVGVKNPTRVYATASNKSSTLKTYTYGHTLKYRTFTSNWFIATVYVNGKARTGYIHKNDVGAMNTALSGYGQKSPTTVYESTSKKSKELKSYSMGSKLKYRSHSKDWYKVTVKYKGKWKTGYIHAKDIGENIPIINGYAHASPTVIYSKASKGSKSLRSYAKGSKLKYRPHSKNWYKATVMHNGKWTTGFIHKKDVGTNAPSLMGYAIASPTTVYSSTLKSSAKLRSYKKGSKLKYQPHNKNWYKATVKYKGKWTTGYIHKRDVGDATSVTFVNPRKTYTYNHMVSDIKNLEKAYPDLISYKVIGKSEYGRDLYAVSLGKGKATTFVNGSLHAREWITTNLNMNMLESYAKAYQNNSSIQGYNARNVLNDTTIWFMPMVNPDGVTLQQQGLSAFPKKDHASLIRMNSGSRNFKRWKANAKGVDLNRNFSIDWRTVRNNVRYPNHQNHKGSSPASAKETKAVIKLVKEINPEMTINYHTSGEVIYWGYNQKGANRIRDLNYARAIGRMTGYPLMPYGGHPSGGGFQQYITETYKRPSITPELGQYAGNTNVPVSKFNRIWSQNQAVGLYAAQESAKLYKRR